MNISAVRTSMILLFFFPLSLPSQNKSLFYHSFGNFMQMAVFTHRSSV